MREYDGMIKREKITCVMMFLMCIKGAEVLFALNENFPFL